MKEIALIIMVAIVLEALIEYFKTILHMVETREYKTAITQAITIALGIFLAIAFKLQLFNGALVEFYENLHVNPALDMILTGILFSRGSNYFSDLIGKLTKKDTSLGEIIAVREDGLGFEDDADYEDEEEEFLEEEEDEDGTADISEA
jgi:hypothetical protein